MIAVSVLYAALWFLGVLAVLGGVAAMVYAGRLLFGGSVRALKPREPAPGPIRAEEAPYPQFDIDARLVEDFESFDRQQKYDVLYARRRELDEVIDRAEAEWKHLEREIAEAGPSEVRAGMARALEELLGRAYGVRKSAWGEPATAAELSPAG